MTWIDDRKNLSEDKDSIPKWRIFPEVGNGMSGSAALTSASIRAIKSHIDRPVLFMDLRREFHANVSMKMDSDDLNSSDIPLSYDTQERGHGFSNEESALRSLQLCLSKGSLTVYSEKNVPTIIPQGSEVQSIKEICEKENVDYQNCPIENHKTPSPEQFDDFLEKLKMYSSQGYHIHFNCKGGKARTTMAMLSYAMMMDLRQGETLEAFIDRYNDTGKGKAILKEQTPERRDFLRNVHGYAHATRWEGEHRPYKEWGNFSSVGVHIAQPGIEVESMSAIQTR